MQHSVPRLGRPMLRPATGRKRRFRRKKNRLFPTFRWRFFLNCPVDISESIKLILERTGQAVDQNSVDQPHVAGCPNCFAEASNNQFQSHTCLPPFSAIPSLNEPSQRIRRRPRWKDFSLKILTWTVQWSWLQHWKWTYKLLPMSVNIDIRKKHRSELKTEKTGQDNSTRLMRSTDQWQ